MKSGILAFFSIFWAVGIVIAYYHAKSKLGGLRMTRAKVKRSVLAQWREDIMTDAVAALSEELADLTERDKDLYARGIVRGFRECTSTLSMQQLIKIIID